MFLALVSEYVCVFAYALINHLLEKLFDSINIEVIETFELISNISSNSLFYLQSHILLANLDKYFLSNAGLEIFLLVNT